MYKVKLVIFLGLFFGSSIGGSLPMLWGDTDLLSFTSLIFSLIGTIIGFLIALRIIKYLDIQ
jgi:uncharacterized membrane protein YeaQ/YmgE (transglycosylase-associated protein family)